jgi:hypothetical protein
MGVNKAKLAKNRFFTILLIYCVVILPFTGLIIFTDNAIAGKGSDLIITTKYTVSGSETWDNIIVKSTGKLIVPKSTTLNGINLYLEGDSIVDVQGGTIKLTNSKISGNVNLNGTCKFFNVTNFSTIILTGANGGNIINKSMGGNANFNVSSNNGINISNSSMNLTGGTGFSRTTAWTTNNINGYIAAGGRCVISLNTSGNFSINIFNSSLILSGGNGGDAADGSSSTGKTGGTGGGYSNGGSVSGYIGAGGRNEIIITSYRIKVEKSFFNLQGGTGGDAGNGGNGRNSYGGGGGGGGYGGGTGGNNVKQDVATNGAKGGKVSGFVGSGANSNIKLLSTNSILFKNSKLYSKGGIGGKAGNGGNGGNGWKGGGGGGGGYGGGGGGGGSDNGGSGGNYNVVGYVGKAGDSILNITSNEKLLIDNISITLKGGNGGSGGTGGTAGTGTISDGGGGGGGYGGGGASGGDRSTAGSGTVGQNVGHGGNSVIIFNFKPTISPKLILNITGGTGGSTNKPGGTGTGGLDGRGGTGGGNGGTTGSLGNKTILIPMCLPFLIMPLNNSFANNSTPSFEYFAYNSTISGSVTSYGIQIDNNSNFSSPIVNTTVGISTKFISPILSLEKYYWRVNASYGSQTAGWSEVWTFEFPEFPLIQDFQKSSTSVYRDNNIAFFINATDLKDNESELYCELQYKSPSGNWVNLTGITYIGISPTGNWQAKFKPIITAETGLYTIRCRFNDTENNIGNWNYYTFIVKNNPPIIIDLQYSNLNIFRTHSLNIFVNSSDIETSEGLLNCEFQYRSPTGAWTDIISEVYQFNRWKATFTPAIDAELGNYDFRLNFKDTDGEYSGWLMDFDNVTVMNNLPMIEDIKFSSTSVLRTNPITIYVNCTDCETLENNLIFNIQYLPPSGSWMDLYTTTYSTDHWESTFIPSYDAELGVYDFRIEFIDKDNDTSGWHENLGSVMVLNNVPEIISSDKTSIFEKEFYEITYTALDVETLSLIWTYDSNAHWLNWGSNNHTLYGTAGNNNIGSYWIRINVSDNDGGYDELNFTLTVENINDMPKIETQDILTAMEDQRYEVAYTATDLDVADTLKWKFTTNASWLNWGTLNHTLYGFPTNDHVDNYSVKINVSDGNGGYDEHYFTLMVINVNDPPKIVGAPTTLEVIQNEDKELDLLPYIRDEDHHLSKLKLSVESNYAKVNGLKIIFNYPVKVTTENVKIKVSDGEDESDAHYVLITVLEKDVTSPTVQKSSPNGSNIEVNANITITFSEPMNYTNLMNAISISPELSGDFSGIDDTIIFNPITDLLHNSTYEVTISILATDQAGNALVKPYIWTFKTEVAPLDLLDSDYDGYNDLIDAFPDDPNEWLDTDGDQIGNNADTDDDNDGLLDIDEQKFGTDPFLRDTDGDNYNDKVDAYPLDSNRWEKDDRRKDDDMEPVWLLLIIVIIIIMIIIVVLFLFFKKQGESGTKLKSEQRLTEEKKEINVPINQPPQVMPTVPQRFCLTCGQSLSYLEQYQQYYCYYCQRFE